MWMKAENAKMVLGPGADTDLFRGGAADLRTSGDFTAANILVHETGKPYLLDFERVGTGNEDHDLAWFWIHAERSQDWKRDLLARYWGGRVGSERVRSEWGIRATIVYLALRRLRFSYLSIGDEDPDRAQNLGLLDAALIGSQELFPV